MSDAANGTTPLVSPVNALSGLSIACALPANAKARNDYPVFACSKLKRRLPQIPDQLQVLIFTDLTYVGRSVPPLHLYALTKATEVVVELTIHRLNVFQKNRISRCVSSRQNVLDVC